MDVSIIEGLSSKINKPKLLYNDYKKSKKISYELNQMISNCDSFDFSVAFISESGLAILKQSLLEIETRKVHSRIITSNYLDFNSPKVFRELLKLGNVDVRIFDSNSSVGFHPKGYIFKKDTLTEIVVGSANLTGSALATNQEWNLYLNSHESEDIALQINDEFEWQWEMSVPLTEEWIQQYEKTYCKPTINRQSVTQKEIIPNYMQQSALSSLEAIRNDQKDKALLISATGTGKTYLAAFDVKQMNPKRVLFVVHRRSIAIKAMETFQTIIKDKSMGLFSGDQRELNKDYIFSTVQTISKENYLHLFSKNAFDYIIIDEVHRAGANSYQGLLSYFNPKFLLGMSATPERGDGFDIYKIFDNNIAFEIRLQQAMEYDLLCPFHYYGITDLMINGETIDDMSDFNSLISEKRVEYIIEKIKRYGFSGDKVHGLIFCSRKEEAKKLSELFNVRGYSTLALTGEDNEQSRQEAMDRLESNGENALDYIFTVDIFNEGIDIPKVNQVVMLRPTESAIIFVQQLGRGLRKATEKDYVVVIDFIGNYDKNFLIPMALSGNRNYNKDTLRKFVSEGALIIPGTSSIQFDEISKKSIYSAIDRANFKRIEIIKESYFELKNKLGRIPSLNDFVVFDSIDPQLIFQNGSLGSYHTFLKKYDHKDYKITFTELEEKYLKFISTKLSTGKRVQELEAIKLAIEDSSNLFEELGRRMEEFYDMKLNKDCIRTTKNILSQNFDTGSSKNTFKDAKIVEDDGMLSQQFEQLITSNEEFKKQVLEIINYSIDVYKNEYTSRYKDTDFCLYKKYTYADVCRLLNWNENIVPLNIGGYKYDGLTNTLPVFINYHKDERIADSIKYEDRFIDPDTLIYMSKVNMSLNGKGMENFREAKNKNTDIHLFVRKNKDDETSKEFYYLGLIDVEHIAQKYRENGVAVCEILCKLDQPARKDIYDYIVNN